MRSFRALKIRWKLMLLIVLTSGLVLALAGAGFVAYDQWTFRSRQRGEVETLGEFLGVTGRAAIDLEHEPRAREILAGLRARPDIVAAAYYLTNGSRLADYRRENAAEASLPERAPEAGFQGLGTSRALFRPIMDQGRPVGMVGIQYSLAETRARLRNFLLAVGAIFLGAIALVIPLSSRLQRLISEPILALARTARVVSEKKDYSVRAPKQTEDEVGSLIDRFNEMLAQIERREADLQDVNRQLAHSEAAAQTATQAKSQFLANMSHELRTPLNAIIGFSEMLDDQTFGPLNARQQKYVNNILTSGRHLLQLINDILDLAKIEAGRLQLERERFDVASALHDIRNVVATLANRKRIVLEVRTDGEPLPPLDGDQPKFKQVMYNLLSNAIKFTPDGGRITVTAALAEPGRLGEISPEAVARELAADRRWLCVAVQDTGIGIKPQDHDRVFLEFEQVDSSYGRQQHGTGLGLSLTRKLVELHGGRIWVESEGIEGEGSRFVFLLPMEAPTVRGGDAPGGVGGARGPEGTAETRGTAETPDSDAGRPVVLVIEDDRQGAELLDEYLRCGGYAVVHAWDGDEALRLAVERRPSAITLDILLPKRSGWEVLAALKANPATRDIPVVIVSVTADRQLAFSLGAVDYFVKPVTRERLLESLRRVSPLADRPIQTVLVVDDEPLAVEFVSGAVQAAGYRIMQAANGPQALDLVAEHPPDLVILDLIMPGMSGFEVVRRLRSRPESQDIPIMIYTAKTLTEEDRRQLRDRVQAIAPKAGSHELLRELARLAEDVGRKAARASPGQAGPANEPQRMDSG